MGARPARAMALLGLLDDLLDQAGEPAPLDEPFLEPRDTKKLDKKAEK